MSSKAALLHDLEKKRQEREKLRQRSAKEAAEESERQECCIRIQRFVRGVLARSRWADAEWKSLQKQVQDLQSLAKIVALKGQQFLAPGKVLLTLIRRGHWQVLKHGRARAFDELEEVCYSLASFLVEALRVSLSDVHRSMCRLMEDGGAADASACRQASWTLLEFFDALHVLGTGRLRSSSPRCAWQLAQLLDVDAWGGGGTSSLQSVRLLCSRTVRRFADPARLHAWRVSAGACSWSSGTAPERLQHLAALQSSLLRMALGLLEADHGAVFLEAALAIPGMAFLLRLSSCCEEHVWSPFLGQLLSRYQESSHHRQGSAKALEQEYAMAYAAGNLLELHSQVQLPLSKLLPLLALLVERAVEVSMLQASAGDEPPALQELRRQLKPLVEPAAVARLFTQALQLRHGSENLAVPLRGYQRHCLAVVTHAICPQVMDSLVRLYSVLLVKARTQAKLGSNHQVFQSIGNSIANTIAYMEGGDVCKALWRHIESMNEPHAPQDFHLLHLHSMLFLQCLGVMTSDELKGPNGPVCKHDMPNYVTKVSAVTSRIAWNGATSPIQEEFLEMGGRVLAQLYRICDRQWAPLQLWRAPDQVLEAFKTAVQDSFEQREVRPPPSGVDRILRHLPQAIPFEQRVQLLRARVQVAREEGLARPVVKLTVRRSHLFEDGLALLKDADWRARFQVIFVNSAGRPEQGQDAGGLFKEFWEKLAETAFNPEYGLFRVTEERLLYPNFEAWKYHENANTLLEFLGLVIGKAIFENIVVEPCFAPFFLTKLLGKHNSYYDLQSLDPALFANLQQLKNYSGDISELCLNFVASSEGQEVPLLPNGHELPVTAENRVRYIYLLSDFKLNKELKSASDAFLKGFRGLIDEKWLRILSEEELQQVISGSSGGALDVDDLQRHTELSNCGSRDRLVSDFFTALRAMKPEHQVKLLRFVTSCSRSPLLGFSQLQPPFTLHKVHVRNDAERLPTASTCFNTLKLPSYSSWKVMKQKLEFVILQDAGFELD